MFDYQTIYLLYLLFVHFISLHFPWFFLSFGACLGMIDFGIPNMKNVKGVA